MKNKCNAKEDRWMVLEWELIFRIGVGNPTPVNIWHAVWIFDTRVIAISSFYFGEINRELNKSRINKRR